MSRKKPVQLATMIKSLRNDNDFSDVTLVCEDGDPIKAHKVILAGGSPIFQKMFAQNCGGDDGIVQGKPQRVETNTRGSHSSGHICL